jgi:hypothetical protein
VKQAPLSHKSAKKFDREGSGASVTQILAERRFMHRKRSFIDLKSMASLEATSTTDREEPSPSMTSPACVLHQNVKVKLSSSPPQTKHTSKRIREGSIDIIKKEDYIKGTENEETEKEVKLPDPKQKVDPDVFLAQLLEAQYGFSLKTKDALSMKGFFPEITEDQIAAYDMKLVAACRENDVDAVKSLVAEGQSAECCNRFGESLLHMACRRGFKDMVDYFLTEKQMSVRIRDDCGRTPLHDACWNPHPQTEILQWLIERDPCLLLIADKRGSTPFQYARPQDWGIWRQFLLDNRKCFDVMKDSKETFS